MFQLSESGKAAWQRYESGQGRFRFAYYLFYSNWVQTSYDSLSSVTGVYFTDRGIQATDTRLSFPSCSFYSDIRIGVDQTYVKRGNFCLRAALLEYLEDTKKWHGYYLSQTPWFRITRVERVYGQERMYRYTGELRAKIQDEKLFFGTQYPYTVTTEFKKTYEDIFKYYAYLGKDATSRTWGNSSEIASLLSDVPEEDYDYSGDGLQILFNHFRNRGYYLKFGYIPVYTPTNEQWAQYDKDFDLQAVQIQDLDTVDSSTLPTIYLSQSFDIPTIQNKDFVFDIKTFNVQDTYSSVLTYEFSPALDMTPLSSGTYREKRQKIRQMHVKAENAMTESGGSRDYFAVGNVSLSGQSIATETPVPSDDIQVSYTVPSKTSVITNVTINTLAGGRVHLRVVYTEIGVGARTIDTIATLPYTFTMPTQSAFVDMVFVKPDITMSYVSVTSTGHSYVPWSGNSKEMLLLPGTYSMPSVVGSAEITGYCINVYKQQTRLSKPTTVNTTKVLSVDAHTYNRDVALAYFSILLKKQYTISLKLPLMPFYEVYDIVKLVSTKGSLVAQIVQKKESLDSCSMEIVFECQSDPSDLLPYEW